MCLMKKINVLGKVCLGMSYSTVHGEVYINESVYIKISLKRNTVFKSYILISHQKGCDHRLAGNLTLYFPNGSVFTN